MSKKPPQKMKNSKLGIYPLLAAYNLVSGKWKLAVFWCISKKVNRFGEIMKALPGISKRMLTKDLRGLEADKLISRKVFPEVPPRVEYSLTKKGESLLSVLDEFRKWGQKNT